MDESAISFLEEKGIISKHQGAKGRKFLMSKEEALSTLKKQSITSETASTVGGMENVKTLEEEIEGVKRSMETSKKLNDQVGYAQLKETLKYLEAKVKTTHETASTVGETIKMFQSGIKTEEGKEIKVNLPESDDFEENPC